MQILYVGNGNYKHAGLRYYDVGRKLQNGFIRNGHNVYFVSDRDIARSSNIFRSSKLGTGKVNKTFIETCENYRPELIVFGHADLIEGESLRQVRAMLPHVRMAQWNVDPLFRAGNVARITAKVPYMDATFATTAGKVLMRFNSPAGVASYMPNPVDASIEYPRCHERSDQVNDVFWAARMAGGSYAGDPRLELPRFLLRSGDVRIDCHGTQGRPELYGAKYYCGIANARMGLNISSMREGSAPTDATEDELYLYSSDRIAHYMGSGLLTLTMHGNKLEELFKDNEEIVLFSTPEELLEKVRYFKEHDALRRSIAHAGWKKSHECLNERLVAKYIVETTMRLRLSEDYVWPTKLY